MKNNNNIHENNSPWKLVLILVGAGIVSAFQFRPLLCQILFIKIYVAHSELKHSVILNYEKAARMSETPQAERWGRVRAAS